MLRKSTQYKGKGKWKIQSNCNEGIDVCCVNLINTSEEICSDDISNGFIEWQCPTGWFRNQMTQVVFVPENVEFIVTEKMVSPYIYMVESSNGMCNLNIVYANNC